MIGVLGQLLTLVAFVACLVAGIAFYKATREALVGAATFDWGRVGRWAWGVSAGAIGVAGGLLLYLLVTHQFQYAYVYQYSARALPMHYLVATFWAGQEGSFLLWILLNGLLGFSVLKWSPASWRAPVMATVALCQFFLLSMIVGLKLGPLAIGSSPFASLAERFPEAPMLQVAGFVPTDGNGLNDLLQNPWMVIHPPTLFTGFAAMLVPFAFAVAALWTRRYTEWVRPALPWTIMATMILGIGITLGGYWAYVTLSFGGYWAWDPVENSSFVPWLVGVAGLHAMLVQKKSAAGHKSAIVLAILAFMLVVYSTFLTRSGILGDLSVHSFVDLGLSNQLLVWILTMGGVGFGLFAARYRELPKPEREAPYLSREFLIFSGAMLLCAFAAVIIVGTSAPIFGRIFRDNPSGVPVSFYNEWSLPIAVGFMFLVALGQLFWWHRMSVEQVNRVVFRPLVLAVASTIAILITTPFVARTVRPAAAAAASTIAEAGMLSGAGAFWTQYGMGLMLLLLLLVSFFALYSNAFVAWRVGRGNLKMVGGGLAHVGLALTVLGIIASSAFSNPLVRASGVTMPSVGGTSRDNFVLTRGESRTVGDYTVAYTGREKTAEGRDRFVIRFDRGGRGFTLEPVVYQNAQGQWIQHPDVQSFVERDVYAAVTPAAMFDQPDSSAARGEIELAKGASTTIGENAFRVVFEGYETAVPPEALTSLDTANVEVAVAARLQVTSLATNETRTLRPVFVVMADGSQQYVQNRVPEWDLGVTFTQMNVDTGNVTLGIDGVKVTPEDWVVVQAYEKPFIGLVWAGITLLSIGFLIAFARRIGDMAKRPLAEG